SMRCAWAPVAASIVASNRPVAQAHRFRIVRCIVPSCLHASGNGATKAPAGFRRHGLSLNAAPRAPGRSKGTGAGPAAVKIAVSPPRRVVVTGQTPSAPAPMTYREAGVDIDAGNALVERIKPLVKRSFRPEVMGGLGGFGALFDLSGKYREPVLVSGTDGVGTKLKLAQQLGRHDTIGIDLVGMCVNDVL